MTKVCINYGYIATTIIILINFIWKIVIAKIQCTYEEIAAVIKMPRETVRKKFASLIKEGQFAGRSSLRRQQFKIAERNAIMSIWLGKQYLEQVEPLPRIQTQDTNQIKQFLEMHDSAFKNVKESEQIEEAEILNDK
jgi:hypothetical protein